MAKFKFISIIFLLFIISANCEISPSVIIVGAGPAGIAAASRLLENNFTNTKILEAEGRIGGRIHSVKFGDAIVDLGAQWCHGEKNNIVYQLVKDFDLLEPTDWPQTFYHSSHEHIDENFVEELYELSHRLREKQKVDQEISLGDYVTAKYNESITERYRNDSEKLKFASEYLNVLHKEVISSEGTFSWFDSSAKSDFEVSDGNNNLNWKGRGYKTLLDVLMKTSPESEKPLFSNDKIIFNKEVRKIVWDDNVEHGASVECSDNSIYKADHVIFTPSLGVLKERYNTLFQPQLPLEKIHAIKELGIAAVGKAFLHFPQRWWPTENFSYVGLMWSEKDRMELSQEFHDLHELILSAYCDVLPSIIIVGAGPAGIAAASRLLENDFTNIKIVEAEGRIGGRIHSVTFGDAIVDLGAEWCHGDTVYELVKNLDLLEPTDFAKHFYHSSRDHIDKKFVGELHKLFYEIYYEPRNDSEGISLGDYLADKYNTIITERYGNNPAKLKFALEFLNIPRREILISKGTFSWFDLSAKSDYRESTSVTGLNWKGRGYKTLLDVLMKTYPDPRKQLPIEDKIIYNKEVTKIVWDEHIENGVLIECLDNSAYKADHIILTASLGVLKDRYSTLFHPPLPQEKIDAIKELGIAAVVKVFFYFPERWWPVDNFKSISLFWSEEDKLEFLHKISDYSGESDQCWLLDLVEFYPAEKNPNVLEAWFAGESIPKIESLSDDKLVEGVMYVLNRFLGHKFKHITRPDSVVRFNWYSNPHFRGAYSYQTVESRKREVSGEIALSKPLTASNGKQTLLFAGEATNPIHYATVHGAVETGFREADRIINLYK